MLGGRLFNKVGFGAALLLVLGALLVEAGNRYGIGTVEEMGSGFMPMVMGVLLVTISIMLGLATLFSTGEPEETERGEHGTIRGLPNLRGALCIVGSIFAFMFLGEYFGLLPATFISVFIATMSDRANSVRDAVLMALAMSVLALIVFVWALNVSMPVFIW